MKMLYLSMSVVLAFLQLPLYMLFFYTCLAGNSAFNDMTTETVKYHKICIACYPQVYTVKNGIDIETSLHLLRMYFIRFANYFV